MSKETTDKDLENMKIKPIEEMIREISAQRSLTIQQWRDQWGHWRVGIDWWGENDYWFIVEKRTLESALHEAYLFFKDPTGYGK